MSENVIKIKGLTKRYRKITAVKGLDLEVGKGIVYGFLGPNGAGKTTVIKSVLGLTTPTLGEIEVFGKNLYLERTEIMRNVGAVVEAPALFPDFSALENLTYLTQLSDGIPRIKIEETLETVGLGHVGKQRVGTFSYGMKQRLGIAQSLLPENKLIFLDEPTNGLDPHGILGVRKLISRLCHDMGITIFLSSHLLSEVEQVCDHVAIIDHGVKIIESKVSELMTQREHIEIIIGDKTAFAKFAAKEKLQILKEIKADEDNHTLFLIEGKEQDIPELNRKLVKSKLDIFRIGKHQNTLEDIFVELTGKDSVPSVADKF